MMFVASLLFERHYRAQENCLQPESLRVPHELEMHGTRQGFGMSYAVPRTKEGWILRRGFSYWREHLDKVQSLLNHYAGFAERFGGILEGRKVSSWEDVEKHTPHGFLAHLAGLGFGKQELKNAADLLFAFHFLLARGGACKWRPSVAEWERSVREVLSLFEERFVFVEAVDVENAWQEAEKLGKEQELAYKNPYGDEVLWRFVKVNEVIEVEVKHGHEIFSRFLNSRELKTALRGIRT